MGIRLMYVVSFSALLFVLVGCGGSGGGAVSFDYGGTWTGTIDDSVAGNGTIIATIAHSGSNLAGTWQATFADGTNGGNLVGVVERDQVLMQLTPSAVTACPYDVVTTRSGNTLSGTYAAYNCAITITGTVSITKQ